MNTMQEYLLKKEGKKLLPAELHYLEENLAKAQFKYYPHKDIHNYLFNWDTL